MAKCKGCEYMQMTSRAKWTYRSMLGKGARGSCYCKHPKAVEVFRRVCPKSPRMPGFIGFTAPGENVPEVKTAPKWCPIREEELK